MTAYMAGVKRHNHKKKIPKAVFRSYNVLFVCFLVCLFTAAVVDVCPEEEQGRSVVYSYL